MEEITAAIIAAIVAFITSYLTRYTNITTQSRIDWIQRVREISIEFINSIEISRNRAILQAEKEKNSELFKKLKIYLNPCEEIDKEIIETANNCLNYPIFIKEFEDQIQAYLKAEWERVKYESKGKMYNGYMFAKKYNNVKSQISTNYNEKNGNDMKDDKFDSDIYKINEVLKIGIKIVIIVFAVLLIANLISVHSPCLHICRCSEIVTEENISPQSNHHCSTSCCH